jgi:hypothetical protein
MWTWFTTWLTGIFADKALLWSIAKYAAVLFVGYVLGTWIGGFGDYRRGYNSGYADGKSGARKKIFPNLFGFDVEPTTRQNLPV